MNYKKAYEKQKELIELFEVWIGYLPESANSKLNKLNEELSAIEAEKEEDVKSAEEIKCILCEYFKTGFGYCVFCILYI